MSDLLNFYRDGDCLWVAPTAHADLLTSPEADLLRKELEYFETPRLIVDLSQLPYFGSTMIEFLVWLWRRVSKKEGGRLVIYKPSAAGRDVLVAARLDQLWPIVDDRSEALRVAQ